MASKMELRKVCMTNFINQLSGFMNDMLIIVPNNQEIVAAKNYVSMLSSANPKLLLTYWHTSVTLKYSEQINNGDFEFAINKDYTKDIEQTNTTENDSILKLIDNLKTIAKGLNDDKKKIIMKYLQNITQLTQLYHQN
tara:strand:- start:7782 stop:8195 length:414 start_codon:yes stop_codon:yes gene_type:complete